MMIMQQQQKHRASQYVLLLLPAAVGSASARLLKKEFYETRKMIPSIFPSMLSWIEWYLGVRKDQDRAETKELCSKLLEIIQEMKRDEEDDDDALPRSVTVGLVTP
mmetsp:Transcript_5574/g.9475  ORF Transcript_5574/g.9475 Transcript_5574/m.9475 type:complete len:106 (-) Transcript_5574:202-519(-)